MTDHGVLPNVGVCSLATNLSGAKRNVQDFPGNAWGAIRQEVWQRLRTPEVLLCLLGVSHSSLMDSEKYFTKFLLQLNSPPTVSLLSWINGKRISILCLNFEIGKKKSTDLFLVQLPWHFSSKIFMDFLINFCLVLNKKTYCTLILCILIFGIVCLEALSELEIYCTRCCANTRETSSFSLKNWFRDPDLAQIVSQRWLKWPNYTWGNAYVQ